MSGLLRALRLLIENPLLLLIAIVLGIIIYFIFPKNKNN